jgi:signal transduction histidine kinase
MDHSQESVAGGPASPLLAVESARRLERRIGFFLEGAVYLTVALALGGAAAARDGWLGTPAGWAALVLVVLYLLLFHLGVARADTPGGMGARWLVGFALAQLLLIAVLQSLATPFVGLAFPVLALLMSSTPIRQWPIAIVAVFAVAGVGWGVYDGVGRGSFGYVAGVLVQWTLWTALFGTLIVLLRQGERLAALVAELHRARDALRRQAAQDAELAVLRERARLAREMHDSLGHALVAINVKLEAAERLYARDPAQGAAELDQTRAVVRAAMRELRRSLADLRAPAAPVVAFPDNLVQLAEEFGARTGTIVTTSVESRLPPLGPVAEVLEQIVRELLINAERHAAAERLDLSLRTEDDRLLLRVEDDGRGIRPGDLNRPGHFGIVGIRERLAAVDGSLAIEQRPGGGAQIDVSAPLPPRLEQNHGEHAFASTAVAMNHNHLDARP